MATIRQEKNQQICQVDYPKPEYSVHLVDPEHFAADLLHPSEGPHRPARATLRRVSLLFCAANAFFSSLHRPQNLVFFGKLSRPCLIETSSSASATPCPCPTSSGVTIAWNLKAENTNAFVPSTMTRSPLWASMNGMASGGTNALPAVRVGTASHT